MTTYEQKVKKICDEVYQKFPEQILIDFIQDEIEELLNKCDEMGKDESPTRDEVGALSYECSVMIDVYNPKFEWDIDVLTRLKKALDEWCNDIEQTNILLGLPKES